MVDYILHYKRLCISVIFFTDSISILKKSNELQVVLYQRKDN